MQSRLENNGNNTKKVFYWNGLLDPRGLASAHDNIIASIIAGNYLELGLEKLAGHNVYSVRINKYDRLLFTSIIMNDQPYLMLLDEVLNHDYAKSRFLKPAVLKNYLELHGKPIAGELLNSHFTIHNESELILPKTNNTNGAIKYCGVDFYNQKFIQLDETQLEVVTWKSLPMILSGAPGSGKSCIALLILSQYIESSYDKEYPILYVTESKKLASSMRTSWQALPVAQNLPDNAVQFKSYKQLIKTLADLGDRIFVDKDHCTDWLKDTYIKHYKKLPGNHGFAKTFYANIHLMYQEFRIITGCQTLEAYIELGKKQSLFHEEKEQQWLFEAYTSYQKHLEENKLVHAPFYPLGLTDQYKRIVVDESQDLSHLQLEILSSLSCNKQICFCEDNRQSLADNKSKIPFLKSLLSSWGFKEDKHIVLPSSWRCPEAFINIANTVSRLKSMATGYGELDIVVPKNQTNKGTVKWFDELTKEELTAMQSLASSPDFAVITLPQYKKMAMELFKTPLVFSPDEIKGHEYKRILVSGLFDEPLFGDADKIIGEQSTTFNKKAGHRAKENQANEQFVLIFNAVYTAFTRATDTLYILQKEHHYLRNITKTLKSTLTKDITIIPSPVSQVDNNQWFDQVKIQLNLGNFDNARMIYVNKLNKKPEEFEQFKSIFLQEIKPAVSEQSNDDTKPCIKTGHNIKVVVKNAGKKGITAKKSSVIDIKPSQIPEDIVRLLKNVTETTLTNFLRQWNKNNKAVEYLFHTSLEDGACLFTTLFYSIKNASIVVNCMSMPEFFYLFADLTKDALCRPLGKSAGEFANTTTLLWILIIIEGQNIFEALLEINPDLSNAISEEALCLKSTADGWRGLSIFYMLSSITSRNNILKRILNDKPELAKCVSSDLLFKTVNVEKLTINNFSPIYWLSRSMEGMEILDTLITFNKSLCISEYVESILIPYAPTNSEANISALYNLSGTIEGQAILLHMFVKNPNLVNSSDLVTALCLPLTKAAKDNANTSALYWLASMEGGRQLLDYLFIINSKIGESISVEALCLPILSGPRPNASPLYWLSSCPDGIDILKILFTRKTKLAQSITAKELCLSPSPTDSKRNTSPLALLSESSRGREILTILEKNNPKLGSLIKWHYQNKSVASSSGLFAKPSESKTETPKILEISDSSDHSLGQT